MKKVIRLKEQDIQRMVNIVLNEQSHPPGRLVMDIEEVGKHFAQYGYKLVKRGKGRELLKYCGNAESIIRIGDGWDPLGEISVSLELDNGDYPSGQRVERRDSIDATIKEIELAIISGFNKYSFAIKDCDRIFSSLPQVDKG